ncbi:hypothetical protein MXAN_1169 [Myxococcus xanthus DK 1622]|uniref:Uncharacterized protein n=1 Tax=Myxococcus xanthus (strain DK1622) TaxID=246197 RepID=Q1DD44_MYXXD|nr:hypothetical protein MXAN_1169 [Myxococcus xanthus DK 1622]
MRDAAIDGGDLEQQLEDFDVELFGAHVPLGWLFLGRPSTY